MKLTSKIFSITRYYEKGLWPIAFEGKDGVYVTRIKKKLQFFVLIGGNEYPIRCSNDIYIPERIYSFSKNEQFHFFAPNDDGWNSIKQRETIALLFHSLEFGYEVMRFSGIISVRDFSKDTPKRRRCRRPVRIENKICFIDEEPETDKEHYTDINIKDKYFLRNIWESAEYNNSEIYEKIRVVPSDEYPFLCAYQKYYINEDETLTNDEIIYLFLDDKLDHVEVISEEEPVYYRNDRIKIKSDGKYGFVSLDYSYDFGIIFQENIQEYKDQLNIPISFIYDNIENFGDNCFIVSRNGSKGIIDIDGVELTRIKYSDINYEFGLKNIIVRDAYSGKYGVLDKKGNEIIPTIYSYIEEIKTDEYNKKSPISYIIVQGSLYSEYLCGVINSKGRFVIPLTRQILFFKNNHFFVGETEDSLGLEYDLDEVYDQNIKLDDKYASCQFHKNYYGVKELNMFSLNGDKITKIACKVSGFDYMDECGIDSYLKIWIPWLESITNQNKEEVCLPLDSNMEPFFTQTSKYLTTIPYELDYEVVNTLFSNGLLFYTDFEVFDNYLIDKNDSEENKQCRLFYYTNREIQNCWIGNAIRVKSLAAETDDEFAFDNIIIFIRQQEKVGMIYKGEMCIPCEYDNICLDGDTIYLSLKKKKTSRKSNRWGHQEKTEDGRIIRYDSEVLSDKLYKAQKDKEWRIQKVNSESLLDKELFWFSVDCIINEDDDDYDYEQDYSDISSYEWSDEDAWDAMTDGQYGDYPGSGWDPEGFGY